MIRINWMRLASGMGLMVQARVPSYCDICRLGAASAPDGCPFQDLPKAAGTIIQYQDELPSRVWYIKEGQVALGTISSSGEELSCAVRGAGSVVGVEALLDRPAEYQAWTLTDSILCGLEVDAFRDWLGSLDTPVGAILEMMLEEATRRAAERHGLEGTAAQRVSRFLLQRFRESPGEELVRISQQMLARTLGMRPETLSRALAELKRAGALEAGRTIRLADPEALARVARE